MDRTYGCGSVYQRAPGEWVGAINLPPVDGKRRRKRFVRTTREGAEAALDAWLTEHPRPEREAEGRASHMDAARALGTHTPQEWRERVRAHDGRCHYCGRPWGLGLHKDHMVPVSRGGSDAIDNLAPACSPCNLSKGTSTAEEFRAWAAAVGFFQQPRRLPSDDRAAYFNAPPLIRELMAARRG